MQAGAGVQLHAKPGDRVRAGQPLITLHTDTPERFERAGPRRRTRSGRVRRSMSRHVDCAWAGSADLSSSHIESSDANERRRCSDASDSDAEGIGLQLGRLANRELVAVWMRP